MNFQAIIVWDNPIESGILFISINLVFFTLFIGKQGFFYTFINFLIYIVMFSYVFLKAKEFLSKESLEEEFDNRRKKQDIYYEFISQNFLSKLFGRSIQYFIRKVKLLFEPKSIVDILKIIFLLYLLSLIGNFLTIKGLIWLVFNAILLSPIYNMKFMKATKLKLFPVFEKIKLFKK